ncbi:MAG: acetylxylan esterase [Alistipes sp.]|nr:acetylxylan esterase [Alistipes sp.]
MKKFTLFALLALLGSLQCVAQPTVNVKKYGAEPLRFSSVEEWEQVHRPVIMNFFEREVYGRMPQKQVPMEFDVISEKAGALGGKAIRKEVAIRLEGMYAPILVLIYIPADAKGPVPAFLGMNFKGNHQINADPEITISVNAPKKEELGSDPERGAASSRWPLEMLMDNGYALVTIYRGDVDPDFDDGFRNGIHPLFHSEGTPAADEWGTIGAWAWGLSRVMDYLETDSKIDSKKVAVIGHSRLGKTSLWAGATDPRFAIVISNDSGCGGAALSIRKQGETVEAINKSFPHWFCDNYNKYRNNEEALFVDQQGLIALIAPRPIYVASAVEDTWADPEGEYLSAVAASPVYELYGKKGLTGPMPAVDSPKAEGDVAYHIRKGGHDINLYDWTQYVKFADKYFK